MFNSIKTLREIPFIELYFRFISLLYWPIYWYKWIVITIVNYNLILFYIYFAIDGLFIIILLLSMFRKNRVGFNYFLFQLTTAATYLTSLYSLMMYQTNVYILYIKMIMCILLMIVSWRIIKKDHNDIGVVGLLAGLLILVLTYFY